jgi:hypothetical protein
MKNTILLVFFVFYGTFLFSQPVPNGTFEQWEDFTFYMEPQNWNTVNQVTYTLGGIAVTKSTDAYEGNYSVKLETIHVFGSIDVPGIITLADFFLDLQNSNYGVSGGIYLRDRVTELDGMYKYSGVDGDSAAILVYNYKMNGSDMDTIGYGYMYLHDAAEWTPFKVDMVYQNNHTPDTLNIAIFSSGNSDELHVGSTLLIDNLVLHTYSGVINLTAGNMKINCYPNPASGTMVFETEKPLEGRKILIYDIAGREVEEFPFDAKELTVDVSGLSSGNYIYRAVCGNRILGGGKFSKR